MLSTAERFNLKSKQWEEIDDLTEPRMNCSSCFLGPNSIYAFGGIGPNDYLSTIERFNEKLKIWTPLKIVLPTKLSNTFAVPINHEEILIMGGMKQTEGGRKSFEIDS